MQREHVVRQHKGYGMGYGLTCISKRLLWDMGKFQEG